MDWIIQNKEWLFGGVLVAIPIAIIGWIFSSVKKKQNQKGGDGSINIQIGGDVVNGTKGKRDE